ncbi:hypothetical protein [Amycolatopsis tolypomycina]|uniref:hypothetical protein n=1 Tax=Amycolatopsis tolypomycina TaxID=208445 RepID=UPI000B8097DF|nr:hypothetical protein [Amycolatopsis tolypomycina]
MGLRRTQPHHCATHDHVVRASLRQMYYVAGGIAAAGLLVLFLLPLAGVILVLGSAGAAGLIRYGDRRRDRAALLARPALPVVPSIDSVEVREVLRGELVLDVDGTYRTSVTPVDGHIKVETTFGRPDQDRLREYCKKFRLSSREDVPFSAGFLVLRGPAGLEFTDRVGGGLVVPLAGLVGTQPFLASQDGPVSAKWQVRLGHRVTGVPGRSEIPLWLTPALMPESDQRILQLDLQWLGNWPSAESGLDADRVERLTLYVPAAWGNVEHVDGATVGSRVDPDSGRRLIEWKQISLDQKKRRHTFAVHFEEQIRLSDVIKGALVVSFRGALSGLEGVDLFEPLGGRRRGGQYTDVKTEVTADVELSLNGVRYQDIRVVPDPRKDDPLQIPEAHEFPGVIPDHDTLIALTDAMSTDGYYVKRVIENPPRDRGRADLVNRAWDVAGRRYFGVYPVDFHLVLTGEEAYGSDIRAEAGNTKVRLYVKGAFASKEMEDEIESVWYGLQGIISETLQQRKPGRSHDEHHVGARHRASDVRIQELKRRRERFEDALLNRRISEDVCREILAHIDRDIAELDEGYGGNRNWEG